MRRSPESRPATDNRPTYHPADPLIRFHYSVIRRHQGRFSRHDADTRQLWRELRATFDAQVVGPCFEAAARYWMTHWVDAEGFSTTPSLVGSSAVVLPDGREIQLDLVVAAFDAPTPAERTILALGEAKLGQRLTRSHLARLELLGRRRTADAPADTTGRS